MTGINSINTTQSSDMNDTVALPSQSELAPLKALFKQGQPAKQYDEAYTAYTSLLADYQLNPHDESYKELDLPFSHEKFLSLMKSKAFKAAKMYYASVADKLDNQASGLQKYNAHNIDEHPVYDMMEAYKWLRRSDKPLFAARTYSALHTTRDEFLHMFRHLHLDAARLCLSFANHQKLNNRPSKQGLEMLERYENIHAPALGIEKIDDRLCYSLGVSENEYINLSQYFISQKFIWQWQEINLKHTENNVLNMHEGYYTHDYCSQVISCFDFLNEHPEVKYNPDVYSQLNTSLEAVQAERDKCVEVLLSRIINRLARSKGYEDASFYSHIKEDLDFLLSYEPELEMHQAFANSKYQTFDKFDKAFSLGNAISALRQVQEMSVTDLGAAYYIEDAFSELSKLGLTLESAEIKNANINHNKILAHTYRNNTQEADFEWKMLFMPTHETEFALNSAQNLHTHFASISYDDFQDYPNYDGEFLTQKLDALRKQRAQELMFESMVALPGASITQENLEFASELLYDSNYDMLTDDLTKAINMPKGLARGTQEQIKLLRTLEDWKIANEPDIGFMERMDTINSVVEQMEIYMGYCEKTNKIDNEKALKNHALLEDLLRMTGAQSPEEIYSYQREIAWQTVDEIKEIDLDDKLFNHSNFDVIATLFQCVHILGPKGATLSELTFKRITGLDYKHYTKLCDDLSEWHNKYNQPLQDATDAFLKAEKIISLTFGKNNANATSYSRLASLARELELSGDSIFNSNLISLTGFDYNAMREFTHACVVNATRQVLDTAHANENIVLTPENSAEHPFILYQKALSWILRTPKYNALENQLYKDLGFKSRAQFMHKQRAYEHDYKNSMRKLLIQQGPKRMGAFKYLEAMYSLQGLATLRGEEFPKKGKHGVSAIFSIDSDCYKRILKTYTHDALQDINEKGNQFSFAGKYSYMERKVTALMSMAKEHMNEEEYSSWLYASKTPDSDSPLTFLDRVLQNRVSKALDNLYDNSDNPERASRIIDSIFSISNQSSLLQVQWFHEMVGNKFDMEFDYLCEVVSASRIRQIATRFRKSLVDEDDNIIDNLSVGAATRLRNEMRVVDKLVETQKITADKVEDIYYTVGLKPEHIKKMQDICLRHTIMIDGTNLWNHWISPSERLTRFNELQQDLAFLEPSTLKGTNCDEEKLQSLYYYNEVKELSSLFLLDLQHNRTPSRVYESTLYLHDELDKRVGSSFQDNEMLSLMGLTPEEIKAYQNIEAHVLIQKGARNISYNKNYGDINTLIYLITNLHENANLGGVDLSDEKELKKAGFSSSSDFAMNVDMTTLGIIKTYMSELRKGQYVPYKAVEMAKEMQRFIEVTKIEERYSAVAFLENEVPFMEDFENIILNKGRLYFERFIPSPSQEGTNSNSPKAKSP